MFEHLDDPTPPHTTESRAHGAVREARRRNVRRVSLTATSCLTVVAAAALGLGMQRAGGTHVAVSSPGASSTTVASAGHASASSTTVTTAPHAPIGSPVGPVTPGNGSGGGPGPSIGAPGSGAVGNPTGSGNGNGDGGSSATPPPTTPSGTTLEWHATGDKSVMQTGNTVANQLDVTLSVHNPTNGTLTFDIEHCDVVKRVKQTGPSTLVADTQASECTPLHGSVTPGQTVTLAPMAVKMRTGVGFLADGTYTLWLFQGQVTVTISGRS